MTSALARSSSLVGSEEVPCSPYKSTRRSPSPRHSLLPLHQVLVDLERHIADCETDDADDLVAERDNIFRIVNVPMLDMVSLSRFVDESRC